MKKIFTLMILILTLSITSQAQQLKEIKGNLYFINETKDTSMVLTLQDMYFDVDTLPSIIYDTSQIIYLTSNLKVEDILQSEGGVFKENKRFIDDYWLSVAQVLPGYIVEIKEVWSIYSNEYFTKELIFLDENKEPIDNRYIIWDWRFASDYQTE